MNARIRTKVRIFVASPRDVVEERRRLSQVVEQLNRGLADRLELKIELLRWETHAAPDVGRPQGVIFDQTTTGSVGYLHWRPVAALRHRGWRARPRHLPAIPVGH